MSSIMDTTPKTGDTIVGKEKEAMKLEPTEKITNVMTESPLDVAPFNEKHSGAFKTPILHPVEAAKPEARPDLLPDQQAMYDKLLAMVKEWKEIPSSSGKAGPIVDEEIMWLTRECLLRYLRATKWSINEAAKRLLGTLSWRRDYGVEALADGTAVSPENETGKQVLLGYDNAARPCIYLSPGRQNTQPSPRQVQNLVFMIERAIDFMPPGQENLALVINFKQGKNRNYSTPGIGQGKEVLSILQTHYPERLGRAYNINMHWIVWGFFKIITPFIDPLTRQKLKYNEDTRIYVPPKQLWNEVGGDLNFEYDHETYWPSLIKLCNQKREEWRVRWEKFGKRYGESEIHLRGEDFALDVKSSSSTQDEENVRC